MCIVMEANTHTYAHTHTLSLSRPLSRLSRPLSTSAVLQVSDGEEGLDDASGSSGRRDVRERQGGETAVAPSASPALEVVKSDMFVGTVPWMPVEVLLARNTKVGCAFAAVHTQTHTQTHRHTHTHTDTQTHTHTHAHTHCVGWQLWNQIAVSTSMIGRATSGPHHVLSLGSSASHSSAAP